MKSKARSKRKLFDPDAILTRLQQALERDFREAQHVYCLNDSTTLYAFNRQVSEFRKKFSIPGPEQADLTQEAYSKFRKVNAHMRATNIKLKETLTFDSVRIRPSMSRDEKIHLRARALCRYVLGTFDEGEWMDECRNSSGSSLGVPYSDTSLERKFTFPISVTKRAKRFFDWYLSYDKQLSSAIESLNRGSNEPKYHIVESSRATTVDKSTTARRFICVEPTANMYLQQGIMQMMYKRLAKVGLDVSSLPDTHKQLARYGSITRSIATIDWSSASDCVSIELLRWLIPSDWLQMIECLRCPNTLIEGVPEQLHMISSMGNATTFPIETLVFWSYAVATQTTLNTDSNSLFPSWKDQKSCSVFGDDCIVPSNIASVYMEIMTEMGFIVNKEKSFYGPLRFRESCGGDYLDGYDVRPFYPKAPQNQRLSSLEPWLYILMNALFKKYRLYFGELSYVYDKDLFRTFSSIFSEYRLKLKLVPSYFPEDAGFQLSHDILRICKHYDFRLERIDRSHHGTYRFSYLKFNYSKKQDWHDELRYATWLKKPRQTLRASPHESSIRKIGGYVVAKGISSHWFVPTVKSET